MNDYFINVVVNGEEDLNYLNSLKIHDENKVDFIGLNYYRSIYVYHSIVVALSSSRFIGGAIIDDLNQKGRGKSSSDSYGMLNDLGWEIYPQGMS